MKPYYHSILKPMLLAAVIFLRDNLQAQMRLQGTVIIPASDFLNEIPKGDNIANVAQQKEDWLFNNTGDFLFKWPGNPINGNPDFVKGVWNGKTDQLFWYKFEIGNDGKGTLFFPDPVFHMFDFLGKGAEEVITLSRGYLRVWGSKTAVYSGQDKMKDLMYLKNTVVNHTHY